MMEEAGRAYVAWQQEQQHSTCLNFANTLNKNYHDKSRFDPKSTTITDYLQNTGVLMSICIEDDCMIDEFNHNSSDAHLSGSWLQEDTSGSHIIPMGNIGMILDPSHVDIMCIYPIDGISDGRLDKGCGTLYPDEDPTTGDQLTWWQLLVTKTWVLWRKFTRFSRTPWEDIPCSEFFAGAPDDNDDSDDDDFNTLWGMVDHQGTWATILYIEKILVERDVGHTVCFDDSIPKFQSGSMLGYVGEEPWTPNDWNDVADLTKMIIQEHPKSGVWNEVVMKNITDLEDMKRAIAGVFYIHGGKKHAAKAVAKHFGNKPVLRLDLRGPRGRLFQCPIFEEEEESSIHDEDRSNSESSSSKIK